MNIVRNVATKSSNRLTFFWLKVICCICQANELERDIKHKAGGDKQGASQKSGGPWPTPPLQILGRSSASLSVLINLPLTSAPATAVAGTFGHNSPAAIARELFKPSTDAESLLVSIKKFFLIWDWGSPGETSQSGKVGVFLNF